MPALTLDLGIGTRVRGWLIEVSPDFNSLQIPLQVYQVITNKIRGIIGGPVINSQGPKAFSPNDSLIHRDLSPDILHGVMAVYS